MASRVRARDRALWAVVLAAGDGTRLAPVTRVLYGRDLPKQFASFTDDGRSLLQATMDRIAPLVPADRTVVVVGKTHEEIAREQLALYDGVDIVAQPANLDTAPGILLPLARVLARDPGARVAIFPSDHYVANEDAFREAVDEAATVGIRSRELVTLLGAKADSPETEYGWIVRGAPAGGRSDGRLSQVRCFVEKPDTTTAQRLFDEGALWNTFISTGRLAAFWSLTRKHLPLTTSLYECYARCVGSAQEERVLRFIYRRIAPANFSRAILERADRLAVLSVAGSEWSDWGSPGRLFRSLDGTPFLRALRFQQSMVTDGGWEAA